MFTWLFTWYRRTRVYPWCGLGPWGMDVRKILLFYFLSELTIKRIINIPCFFICTRLSAIMLRFWDSWSNTWHHGSRYSKHNCFFKCRNVCWFQMRVCTMKLCCLRVINAITTLQAFTFILPIFRCSAELRCYGCPTRPNSTYLTLFLTLTVMLDNR